MNHDYKDHFTIFLLAYSITVSQSFMYTLSLKHVQLSLEANPYIDLRKLTDASMRSNFKYVVYTALLTNPLLVIVTGKNRGSFVFITGVIAFAGLIADILLTVKGNLPINDIINNWQHLFKKLSRTGYPAALPG